MFERKFRSVASFQGFDYVLQDAKIIPTGPEEVEKYKDDLELIFDALQHSWAAAFTFFLVEQNKPDKNGRQVYIDAKNYFRGKTMEDSILNENIFELINLKLASSSFKGVEGCNNKFNDIINTLQQQEPPLHQNS